MYVLQALSFKEIDQITGFSSFFTTPRWHDNAKEGLLRIALTKAELSMVP